MMGQRALPPFVVLLTLLAAIVVVSRAPLTAAENPWENGLLVSSGNLEDYLEGYEASSAHYWRNCTDDEVNNGQCQWQIPGADIGVKSCQNAVRPAKYKCQLFDAKKFMEAVSGKRLCFVGDSLVSQWTRALAAYLRSFGYSFTAGKVSSDHNGFLRIRFAYFELFLANIQYWIPEYYDRMERATGHCDYILTGVGVWYHNNGRRFPRVADDEYVWLSYSPRGNLRMYQKHINWIMEAAHERKHRQRIAFIEPAPQHFDNVDGEFLTKFMRDVSAQCVPHPKAERKRLRIFESAAERWKFPVLRVHSALLSRWDSHNGNDCTHFCAEGNALIPAISAIYQWVVMNDTHVCGEADTL